MKRIGIITFHFVNNFGGALQAYAIRKAIDENFDVETELIDYRNWFICLTDTVRLLPISTKLKEIKAGINTIKLRISRLEKFDEFIKANNKMTRKYSSYLQLCLHPPDDDKYICGSDQIWNPILTMGVAKAYYLRFVKDSNRKISYAPSFGNAGVASCFNNKIKKYISEIGYLSIRENAGQDLIREYIDKDVERVIDPTFLLDKDEWEKIAANPLNYRKPYILLYMMQQDEKVYEYARKLKEQTGICLVEISRYGYRPEFVDETLIDVGPAEFLGLFKDATYICTNSYHGLAFSIIFEKEFCLVPCKRFTARIDNMINLLQIKGCMENENTSLITSYNKEYVRNILNNEKEKAMRFLAESIGN